MTVRDKGELLIAKAKEILIIILVVATVIVIVTARLYCN